MYDDCWVDDTYSVHDLMFIYTLIPSSTYIIDTKYVCT